MTNKEILRVAMEQSAADMNCDSADFISGANKVVLSKENPSARKYLSLPFYCDLVSYGGNIVASVNSEIADFVNAYINARLPEHCFETPATLLLGGELQKYGHEVCFMAEYFLPDVNCISKTDCRYETRLLYPADFSALYTKEWSNALCEARKELDVLGVGAFDGEKLIGLAGSSMDCESMWQIGVDVLPQYRRQGIAAALTSKLALEILQRGIVPFYCAAWSNVKSVRNAIASGFKPAWVELTAKTIEFIADMNNN